MPPPILQTQMFNLVVGVVGLIPPCADFFMASLVDQLVLLVDFLTTECNTNSMPVAPEATPENAEGIDPYSLLSAA